MLAFCEVACVSFARTRRKLKERDKGLEAWPRNFRVIVVTTLHPEKDYRSLSNVATQMCGMENKCYVQNNCQNAKSHAYTRRNRPHRRCGLAAKEKHQHRYRAKSKHSGYATVFAVGMYRE